MEKRYLEDLIVADALASRKIAFISGPRQVGKTTSAKNILLRLNSNKDNYFSFDDDEFKKIWTRSPKDFLHNLSSECILLDEIHKDKKWKTKLKGLYDIFSDQNLFMVTGSARLDYYRKSGDSLQGRYLPYRLHPFTLCESSVIKAPPQNNWLENTSTALVDLDSLSKLSGFPDPLWGQSQSKASRWRRLYRERLIREDARDLQDIREIQSLDTLSLLLQERAGSQLSYTSLREDLSTSLDTISRWIYALEALYYCYRLTPYSKNIKNSLKKEPKLFMYDWGAVQAEGARWENMIAGHLLKNVHLWTDAAYGEFELFYLRDKQKREVDFLVTKDKRPWLMVEVKSNSRTVAPSLSYFNKILKPHFCFQVVKEVKNERGRIMEEANIQVLSAQKFLSALN